LDHWPLAVAAVGWFIEARSTRSESGLTELNKPKPNGDHAGQLEEKVK
jgi:hypothetical protein